MSQPLPAALAIDGGNSKTDVALVAPDGALLALVRGPGMPNRLSQETVQVIDELIRSAVKLAGQREPAQREPAQCEPAQREPGQAGDLGVQADGPMGLVAAHLVGCIANVDLPAEERELERMLADQGWSTTTMVANDTYAVLRAGLDDVPAAGAQRHWGVGVTCGTGINCIGVAPDGRTAGFLALGESTGDWGGGGGIGMEAQWHAVRAADGRGPQTALRTAVPGHFGLNDPLDVAEALHLGEISWDRIASLVPVVLQVADAGDEVARKIVLRLAEEVFLLVKSAITRLGLAEEPVPVVLGGGILAAGNALLMQTTTKLITDAFKAAEVRVLRQVPVVGAALMGLDQADASVQAKHRLRNAFASRPAAASV
ncbi:MAG TPA: BadF/BadG/BcrA/BcrD ATPase family protein [Streptosporangiaceae bacterium]